MNAEEINDVAKLIMHRLIARQVRLEPGIIIRARNKVAEIEQKSGSRDFTLMWKQLLDGDPTELRRRLVARDEVSTWLRLTSPFAGITNLPLNDIDLRRRIWKDARRLVTLRTRQTPECNRNVTTPTDQNTCRFG